MTSANFLEKYIKTQIPIEPPTYNGVEWRQIKKLYKISEIFIDHWGSSEGQKYSQINENIRNRLLVYLDYQFKYKDFKILVRKNCAFLNLKEFTNRIEPITSSLPIDPQVSQEEKERMNSLRNEFKELLDLLCLSLKGRVYLLKLDD